MNNFQTDDQRKAVMSKLNKTKVGSKDIKIEITVPQQTVQNKMVVKPESTPYDQISMALTLLFAKIGSKKLDLSHSEKAKALDPYSLGQMREMLDYTLDQWDTGINTWNWERIINEKKKHKEISELKNSLKITVDDYVDQIFGYDKPRKRPETEAEKMVAKLTEPYEEMKDESYGFLGERRKIDHKLVKEIINDYLSYLAKQTEEELPDAFT